MVVLILGGHGFVGKNLVSALKNTAHEVHALSRRDGLDLTDYDNAESRFAEMKPDVVVNAAAAVGSLNYVTHQAAEIFDINMRMLLNVYKGLQRALPHSVLITPIANCAYPGDLERYSEEKFWDGKLHPSVFPYGSTRRMVEVLSDCYRMQYGCRCINFYVPNMYGPFDSTDPNKAHALNALISKAVKAKREKDAELEVWGSGIAVREWLYAEDFARIVVETLSGIHDWGFSESLNIAQNFGLSVRELVDIVIEESEFRGTIKWDRSMPDGARRKVMDDARFRKVFPNFEFTELRDGIKETIKYYESIYPYSLGCGAQETDLALHTPTYECVEL